ncbi:monovalent cation/H+ antiporter subunit D family protein [Alphaproteobacteria bacterium]|nr:monovalent cation/H+ antiporter subunit D family protein [Alphaproteobacteria bacterium]
MTLFAFFNNLPSLLVVVPLMMAPIAALIPISQLAWAATLLATAVSFIAAVLLHMLTGAGARVTYYLGNWAPPWGIEFVVDSATSFVLMVITALGFVVTLFARRSLASEINNGDLGKACGAWLLAIGGLSGLVLTADAFNLFVFLEISALASITLIALGAGRVRRSLIAAYNYLIIGAVGATFYVIGVGFIYAMTGSLNMADLAERLPDVANSTVIYVGFGFMVAGILVKAAVFPVHIWLPSAYSYAPSAVSTLLAAIATKAAIYVLARIVFTIFVGVPDLTIAAMNWVIIPLSLAGIFTGTILAIYESDIKKLLAHSSVAQIGYITLGIGVATTQSLTASFIHIGNHALMKGGLFMAVGGFFYALGQRVTVYNIVGMGRRMPITATAFLICGLSLIGLPLTAGFISKLYLVRALLDDQALVIVGLVLLSSALSLIYLWKIVEVMWSNNPAYNDRDFTEQPALYIPLWILASANIWFGIDSSFIVKGAEAAARALGGGL